MGTVLDALLAKLRGLGSVLHERQGVEDVTRKHIDAEARRSRWMR